MKQEIWAIDFDGTLCESQWPDIGAPRLDVINAVKKAKQCGDKIILWTCREGERLKEAVEWCKKWEIEFDAVNDNLPEMIKKHGGNNSRKIFADYYVDDKNLMTR